MSICDTHCYTQFSVWSWLIFHLVSDCLPVDADVDLLQVDAGCDAFIVTVCRLQFSVFLLRLDWAGPSIDVSSLTGLLMSGTHGVWEVLSGLQVISEELRHPVWAAAASLLCRTNHSLYHLLEQPWSQEVAEPPALMFNIAPQFGSIQSRKPQRVRETRSDKFLSWNSVK